MASFPLRRRQIPTTRPSIITTFEKISFGLAAGTSAGLMTAPRSAYAIRYSS